MGCSCSTSSLVIGSAPVIQMTFRDVDGSLVDPTSITVKVKPPSGSTTVADETACTRVALGVWRYQLAPCLLAGDWWAYVTSDVEAAQEIGFQIADTRVPLGP